MTKEELNIRDVEDDGLDDHAKVFANVKVPVKYRGTAADQHDMMVLGKKQVLRRNFKFVTMLGFASTVLVGWEILPVFLAYQLEDGGTPIVFWGAVAGVIGFLFVYASIAEMASMSPTAGGQYHWVSEFAPPSLQKGLSYSVGWQVYLAGVCFIVANVVAGIIALNNPDYVARPYHVTLLAIAVITFSVVFNTALAVRLPLIEGIMLCLHIAGLFGIVIPLWILAPRGDPKTVLLMFTDSAGWSNVGLSSLIGMIFPVGLLIGYDCTIHMSEEVQDASIVLPRAIMWTVPVNSTLNLIMAVTLIFCIGDLDSVINTPTGEPFIQIFYNATQSYVGTTIMTSIIIIMLISCAISEVATASRQIWSFARDRGLPGSTWLSHVNPGWNIPLRAVSVSIVVSALLALINLGSSVALNAINSLGGVSICFSYFITITCLVQRRLRGPPLPPRRWSLGRWGLLVNIVSLLFILPILFFFFWPLAQPVNPTNLNWSPVMFVSILLIALLYYVVKARHEYTGPVVLVKRQE